MKRMRRIGGAALLGAGVTLALYGCGADVTSSSDGALVYRVPVNGVVELGLAPFIERSIAEAEAAGADAVVLDIETPGGRVDAAQRIANAPEYARRFTNAYTGSGARTRRGR